VRPWGDFTSFRRRGPGPTEHMTGLDPVSRKRAATPLAQVTRILACRNDAGSEFMRHVALPVASHRGLRHTPHLGNRLHRSGTVRLKSMAFSKTVPLQEQGAADSARTGKSGVPSGCSSREAAAALLGTLIAIRRSAKHSGCCPRSPSTSPHTRLLAYPHGPVAESRRLLVFIGH